MVRYQNANATLGQVTHELLNIPYRDGVDTRERFIEQHEGRAACKCAGDFHAAAFTTGKGDTRRFPQVGEAEFSQQLVELLPAFLPVWLDHFQNGANILFHRQATEDGRFLGQIADAEPGPPVHGHTGDVEAFQRDLALIRPDKPGDHVEGRGLAGAIRPQRPTASPGFTDRLTYFTT